MSFLLFLHYLLLYLYFKYWCSDEICKKTILLLFLFINKHLFSFRRQLNPPFPPSFSELKKKKFSFFFFFMNKTINFNTDLKQKLFL